MTIATLVSGCGTAYPGERTRDGVPDKITRDALRKLGDQLNG
jgi:hypothetical protein